MKSSISLIRKFFRHSLTESDNETFDIVRVSFFLSVVSAIAFTGYALWKSGVFDVFAFSTGLGALLGGGGAGMGVRAKMEGPAITPMRPMGMPIKPMGMPTPPMEDDEQIKPPRMGA